MKQRMALALALVTEPKFLLLDEPFVGLDPIGVGNLIGILKKWSKTREISMMISSHQLGELEELCNRYVYIENGRLKESIAHQTSNVLLIHLTKETKALSFLESPEVKLLPGNILELTAKDSIDLNRIFAELGEKNLIKAIEVKENKLKDYFKN